MVIHDLIHLTADFVLIEYRKTDVLLHFTIDLERQIGYTSITQAK